MKYSLVIFDFDGTLCNNRLDAINSIKATYQCSRKPNSSDDEIKQALKGGGSSLDLFKRLNPGIDDEAVKQLKENHPDVSLQSSNKKTILFEGVIALLAQLKEENIPCIIVSSRDHQDLCQAVKATGLMEYVAHAIGVIGPDYITKPNPLLYAQSIKPLLSIEPRLSTIQPNEIIVIGDTIADLCFAKAIGADACWVNYGYGDPKACRLLSPQYIVNDVEALNAILTKEYIPSHTCLP